MAVSGARIVQDRVFDPQAVAEEAPTWWWNPLSYVKNEATAGNMAQHFANGSREPGTKADAYFDPAGQNLLKAFLLAASLNSPRSPRFTPG